MDVKKSLLIALCSTVWPKIGLTAVSDNRCPLVASACVVDRLESDQAAAQRGGEVQPPFGGLTGRSRLGGSLGIRSQSGSPLDSGVSIVGTDNLTFGFGYAYWLQENLALTFTYSILAGDVTWNADSQAIGPSGVTSALAGARLYLGQLGSSRSIKPYIAGSVGPYIASMNASGPHGEVSSTTASAGGQVGGGLDMQLTRSFMLGVRGGYNIMSDFSSPQAGKYNFNGPALDIEISWLFGKGRSSKR